MALSGIEIFKLLPKTNCQECGVPTCMAFAVKLAAGQAELDSCPYVSDESQFQLQRSFFSWLTFFRNSGSLVHTIFEPRIALSSYSASGKYGHLFRRR